MPKTKQKDDPKLPPPPRLFGRLIDAADAAGAATVASRLDKRSRLRKYADTHEGALGLGAQALADLTERGLMSREDVAQLDNVMAPVVERLPQRVTQAIDRTPFAYIPFQPGRALNKVLEVVPGVGDARGLQDAADVLKARAQGETHGMDALTVAAGALPFLPSMAALGSLKRMDGAKQYEKILRSQRAKEWAASAAADPIHAAVVRNLETGELYRGTTHNDAIEAARRAGVDDDLLDLQGMGFETRSGQYLTREQADAQYGISESLQGEWGNRDAPDAVVADAGPPTGLPETVYHGTGEMFRGPFDPARVGLATDNATAPLGFFFSAREPEAARYVKDFPRQGKTGGVIPARLDVKNPYHMPYVEWDRLANGKAAFLPPEQWGASHEAAKKAALARRAELEAEGYDGIVIGKGPNAEYVAFRPEQITRLDESTSAVPPDPESRGF